MKLALEQELLKICLLNYHCKLQLPQTILFVMILIPQEIHLILILEQLIQQQLLVFSSASVNSGSGTVTGSGTTN